MQRKEDFAEVSKNLTIDTNLKIILLNYQNNYIRYLNWLLEYQNFLQHCLSSLSFVRNYFKGPKLFSEICI